MPTGGFKRLLTKWSTFNSKSTVPLDPTKEPTSKTDLKQDKPPPAHEPMMPFINVCKKGSVAAGFIVLRLICIVLFSTFYLLSGTYFRVRKSKRPTNYNWSARVFHVVIKHKYDHVVSSNSLADFILRHEGFDHPRRVLANEVSLYEINEREAIFVEAPPGVEVWRSRYGAFFNDAQINNACKVIVLPIESFYRLSNELGDPKGRLVFITNTARCGSTLLSRVFEETDEFVTISEPSAINYLRKFMITGRENEKWVQEHAQAIVRVLCKPTDVKNYVIKITPTSTCVVPLLQKIYPNASQLFIYRDGLPVSKSMYKIWLELPMGNMNVLLAKYFQSAYIRILNWSNYYDYLDNKKENLFLTPGYGQGCFYWGNVINQYRKFRDNGYHIAAVKYEDLVKEKEFAVKCLFDYCAIPAAYVKPAMRAFNTDSQVNSQLSMNNLSRIRLPEFTPEVQNATDRICEYFALAKLGESCVIEGTLTRETIECPIKV